MRAGPDSPALFGCLVIPWVCALFSMLVGGAALLLMPSGSNSVNRDPHRAAMGIAGFVGVVALGWTLLALGSGRVRFGRGSAALLVLALMGAAFLLLVPAIA
jgi:hypothetical protein